MNAREIEDVLSSIRRLVSEDLRPAPGSAAARAAALVAPAPVAGDKLILTPALRVVDSSPRPMAELVAEPVQIEDVVASLGAAVDAQDQSWEPETGDAPVLGQPPADWGRVDDDQWTIDDEAEPAPAALRLDRPYRPAPVAEVVPQPEPQPDLQPEPGPEPVFVAHPRSRLAEAPDLPGWAQDGADADEAAPDRFAEATVEPDRAWADAAEAEVLETLAREIPEAVAASFGAEAQGFDPAGFDPAAYDHKAYDAAFDPEALRDLVRELLIEELQGPLGERITRNIRKLVRAEIARAFATEQLT